MHMMMNANEILLAIVLSSLKWSWMSQLGEMSVNSLVTIHPSHRVRFWLQEPFYTRHKQPMH